MKKAVLFLVFNRLDTTKKVFQKIKEAQPPRLYIASDGARKDKKNELKKVEEIREYILDNIDWDCEVKTLFREKNLGCRDAVSGAITWFFNQEKDGIILEDDCLPEQSFFNYCEELLDYYKDDKKIWHISGDQFVENFNNGASYYFAKVMHCWGWASWADRWDQYEVDLGDYDEENIKKFSDNENVQDYWLNILNASKSDKVNTWDYQWIFKIIENDGLCINPAKNLVSNIGFGDSGTHTDDENDPFANLESYAINKIIHPKVVELDINAVNSIYRNVLNIDLDWKYYDKSYFENEGIFLDYGWPWFGHKFFAYDLVCNIRPKRIVELGTHYGSSLWAFSQATKDKKINVEINAIDSWEGERHAGFYGEEVFETVRRIKETFYSDLNINLIRKRFENALDDFEDDSIDVLSIDGLHTYEAVKSDFETWLPKVKDDGIILFHDIKVNVNDFGVHKFWNELKNEYKTIEFFHSFGLGVLFKDENSNSDLINKNIEFQMHYSYICETLKNWKILSLSGEMNEKKDVGKQKINSLQNQLNHIQSSKFWKLRNVYIDTKNKIKFAVFCPKKFIKKYLKF